MYAHVCTHTDIASLRPRVSLTHTGVLVQFILLAVIKQTLYQVVTFFLGLKEVYECPTENKPGFQKVPVISAKNQNSCASSSSPCVDV